MRVIYEEIVRLLTDGKRAVLATVIQQVGSAPRTSGAQMLIREDGSSLASVGGGRLEGEVLKEAPRVLKQGEARVLPFYLTGKDVADTDMICGGNVQVFLEPLTRTQPEIIKIFTALVEVKKTGGKGTLATVVEPGPLGEHEGIKVLVTSDGRTIGSVELTPEAREAAQQVMVERVARLIPWGQGRLYMEPVFSEPTLYLFGAGHVSRYIAPVAKMVEFRVVVIDDRPEYANSDYFPRADDIWVESFEGLGRKLDLDDDAYLVIVTRGHVHDYTVLKDVLGKGARYIGMIGSRRKRDLVYKQLKEDGVSQAGLAKVHSPIGLDIKAETPEEIAVSIVAELIRVRNEGSPARRKDWAV